MIEDAVSVRGRPGAHPLITIPAGSSISGRLGTMMRGCEPGGPDPPAGSGPAALAGGASLGSWGAVMVGYLLGSHPGRRKFRWNNLYGQTSQPIGPPGPGSYRQAPPVRMDACRCAPARGQVRLIRSSVA